MEKLTNQSEWIERAKEVLPAGGFGNFDPSIFIKKGMRCGITKFRRIIILVKKS